MAMQLPSSSSFSSVSNDFTYDVFISFRGPDTRHGFTGYLYNALSNKGIETYIDDEKLPRGDEITLSLRKSIEDSRIAIIVFSENYASSSFCLDELAHIVYYFKEKGRLVLPVFYGVEPTDVRYQTGSYAGHLTKHEEKNMDRLPKWKKALTEAANLSGHHIKPGMDYEYKSIIEIVKDVSNKINDIPLYVADYPVGLTSQISEVSSLLDLGSDKGVCIIGIHGIAGIGKTTLARAVFNSIANQFEFKCSFPKVREASIVELQKQLLSVTIGMKDTISDINMGIQLIKKRLSRKKILLILDDVDKQEQLQSFVPHWLRCGSKVIVTTRDKQLLDCYGIKITHEVCELKREDALELFRWKVGKSGAIDSNYEDILNRAITYTSGLPLAIEKVGSDFSGMHMSKWNSTLDMYKRVPHKDIKEIFKLSFEALDEEQKSVFLDIACCLKGYELKKIEEILHAHYDYSIEIHVGRLVDKSILRIDLGVVTLNRLLEDMAKENVRQESSNKPGESTRLWFHGDIVEVLKENMGTEKIKMIYLNCPSMKNVINWNGKAFEKMTNLKTLIIKNGIFSRDPEYLPSSLRFWEWKRCHMKSLSSCILNKEFKHMKVLTLDDCQYLNDIPDVSGLQNLKKFSFQNCDSLITIHNSNWNLNKLEILNASGCDKIESFPSLSDCHLLRVFYLNDCKSLEEIRGFPPNLKEFSARRCNSLSSSSIRMLLSQKRYEAGCKEFCFPNGTEGIPDWFEHQSRGHKTISFQFRKKIPSINVIILLESKDPTHKVKFYVNDCPRDLPEAQIRTNDGSEKLPPKHAVLFDLKLEEVLSENEWITVMLKLEKYYFHTKDRNVQMGIHVWKEKNNTEEDVIFTNPYSSDTEEDDDESKILEVFETEFVQRQSLEVSETETVYFAQMGIHEESNTEEDVIFTNPYSDTKFDEYVNYSNTSLSESEPPLKKKRLVEVGVSETQIPQQQNLAPLVSDRRNLDLTETKEKSD